jgi:hypothetical protein
VLQRLFPPLLLAVLAAVFFAPLVLRPDGTLYSDHSDLLAHYLPAKHFLVESRRETGELPRWCPYSLGGMPFIHDPQVGAFYPPHWLLWLVPSDLLGTALSWCIVLHLLVAGWGTYACAREQGLDRGPALVSAFGFMFAGKWLLHLLAAGHYTTIGLAWLPWTLLCLQRSLRQAGFAWATAAAACFALVILGTQPQWAFYAGIFLIVWTVGSWSDCSFSRSQAPAWERTAGSSASPNTFWRWICSLVYRSGASSSAFPSRSLGTSGKCFICVSIWAPTVAITLSAVQWLPTLEAAALSTRGAGVASEDVLAGGLRALTFLVGPALTTEPANLAWEDRGGFGLLWIAAAAMAPLVCPRQLRWRAAACTALIVFSLGGAALVQWLPGFRLFRQPTRMLAIVALPVALLAGETLQALLHGVLDDRRGRRVLLRVAAAVATLAGGFAVRQLLQGKSVGFHPYWMTLIVTLPLAYWVLSTQYSVRRAATLGVILVVDLWALTWPLVQVRPEAEINAPSASVVELAANRADFGRVLDMDLDEECSPLGRGAPMALLHRLHAIRGLNPLDIQRTKNYLQQIADDDASLRPFEHTFAFPVVGNVPIRNRQLLNLLGVRYLLQPRDVALDQPGWRKLGDDPEPVAFDLIAGGRRNLPAYSLYENEQVLPRVFIVPRAVTGSDIRDADFRNVVVLEETVIEAPNASELGYWSAAITEYEPNQVRIETATDSPGWLVLTDVWYPGWNCTVDGVPVKVYRGDFLFRAVHVEAGGHEVVFSFEPESYRWGRIVSGASLATVALVFLYSIGFKKLKCSSACRQ